MRHYLKFVCLTTSIYINRFFKEVLTNTDIYLLRAKASSILILFLAEIRVSRCKDIKMILSPKCLWSAAKLLVAQWRSQAIVWRLMIIFECFGQSSSSRFGDDIAELSTPAIMYRWMRSLLLSKQFLNFKFRKLNSCDVVQTKITSRLLRYYSAG